MIRSGGQAHLAHCCPINAFINIIFDLITYCHQPNKLSLNLFSAYGLDIIHIKLKRPNKGRFYKKILPVNSYITMKQAVCPQGDLFRTTPFPEIKGKIWQKVHF